MTIRFAHNLEGGKFPMRPPKIDFDFSRPTQYGESGRTINTIDLHHRVSRRSGAIPSRNAAPTPHGRQLRPQPIDVKAVSASAGAGGRAIAEMTEAAGAEKGERHGGAAGLPVRVLRPFETLSAFGAGTGGGAGVDLRARTIDAEGEGDHRGALRAQLFGFIAAASSTTNSVVHLPGGGQSIATTLSVPANEVIQITEWQITEWAGADTGPIQLRETTVADW